MTALLKDAKRYCEERALRLTDPRLNVLRILSGAKKPLTAYEILDSLARYQDDPKPPTAYRAIEFWQSHGFIHRIESLNAYISCEAGHKHRGSQFMVCDSCGQVEEVHLCSLPKNLAEAVKNSGFNIHYWNAEIHGTCNKCQ